MQQDTGVTAVAHVIQLAVAPVFLLSAIGAILAVMTNRLGRVVDRARTIEADARKAIGPLDHFVGTELDALSRRAKLISRSITLCTATALLICAVIAVLFLGASLRLDTSAAVSLMFITAMATFFVALVIFLREIGIAAASTRIGLRRVAEAQPATDAEGDT